MRDWHLTAKDPLAPRIAADARDGRTNYADDQVWQLRLGAPSEPALALETRYGGRVGLARLVPQWTVGRRQVYEAQAYHQPPVLEAFAPNWLRVRAGLTATLALQMDFWAMESRAVGGRFVCQNTGDQPQTLGLGLAAQMAREGQTLQMFFLTLENNQVALQMGRLRNLQPILLVEDAIGTGASARLTRNLSLEPGQSVAVRWVLASTEDRDSSLLLAHQWLAQPSWDRDLEVIAARAETEPQIETGRAEWDAALAWSQQMVLRAFLAATGSLPHPSFVSSRKTNQGYAVSGVHPGGFNAPWGGQSIPEALLIAPTVALAAPDLAEGIVRNFIAVQRDDGWIDARPGLDGQRANVLAPPLLATLAYTVYEYTQRDGFLRDTFDGLLAFFRRWLQPDLDQDGDGLPEWSRPEQGAFGDSPTLARSRRWAQGADINTIEAPDLAAYLLREAASLIRIAQVLGDQGVADEVALRRDALREHLQAMWNPETGAFHYRDRDTDAVPLGEIIFEGKGDQPLRDRTPLPHASRLILRVIGGLSHKPRVGCTIEGVNGNGQPTHETLDASAFDWYRGMGSATTRTVWREITDLKFDGLSRVYTVQVSTVDLSRHDQSLFMPLWTDAVTPEQVGQMVAMLTDPARYGREYGIPACPANDPAYDPTQQNGCGAVWPRWTTLIAWGLLDHGYRREAAMLFERLLNAQIRSLTTEQVFRALYNPDTGEGLGDSDVVEGVVSLGWFARLFGAFVPRPGCVMITGPLAFEGQPMIWTQHGIRIERSPDSTAIRFASGHSVTLPPDADAQLICDEQPAAAEPPPLPLARTDPADPGTPNVEPESALPVDDAEPDDEQPALPPYDGLLPDVD